MDDQSAWVSQNAGAWRWVLETMGYTGEATIEARALLERPRDGDDAAKTRDNDALQEWYEARLDSLRSEASAALRQDFDPRPKPPDGQSIGEHIATEVLGIGDHFACEDALNWGGDYTYVSVFDPVTERDRIAGLRDRMRERRVREDPEFLAAVGQWESELAMLQAFLNFLCEKRFSLGVRLLSALC